jgi:transposase
MSDWRDDRIAELEASLVAALTENEALRAKLSELESRLQQNSSNSSLPPSSDRIAERKRRAEERRERRAAKRKPGKQPGAPSEHLARVADPNEVVLHAPTECHSCGGDLSHAEVLSEEVRQVFDVPEPEVRVTEHRVRKLRCSCGAACEVPFPPEATAPACYGPRVRAFALYLMARQHLPFERAAEAMADLFNVECSTGFLDSVYDQGAARLGEFIAEVRRQLCSAEVVHFDETGLRVRTSPYWLHVMCTEFLTLLHADPTRGKDAIGRAGVLPGFRGVAVHDRLAQYFDYDEATHAVCNAHVVRNLTSVARVWDQAEWANTMKELLLEMKEAADEACTAGRRRLPRKQLASFMERYDTVVTQGIAANLEPSSGRKRYSGERESYNLALALRNLRSEVTRFATDLRIPFDNNQGERDLRMAKLQLKISGSFRSEHGAERLATVRSYISTATKQGLRPLEVLTSLFAGQAWVPRQT